MTAISAIIRRIILLLIAIGDILLVPFVLCAALLFKLVRLAGIFRMPLTRKILYSIGVFPILDHYYEPLFNSRHLRYPLRNDRNLPGIDWNVPEQLELLDSFHYNDELSAFPMSVTEKDKFYYNNDMFNTGDAESLYNIIRHFKPARIIEIGSGFSTLMACNAIKMNSKENPSYRCEHICVEPYENLWLDKIGVRLVRDPVETLDVDFFRQLGANDLLFIDSSHMIRPQGDVLFEYLEIMPLLASGVIVHVHDIFTPKDYLDDWIENKVKFWNEQYLLEAFLCHNSQWKIIGALNYLHHHHYEKLLSKCPFLTSDREPGSFYMVKL